MSQLRQSSPRSLKRNWAALLPILLLAPLSMAPKGCSSAVVGDDCPAGSVCGVGTAGTAGTTGNTPGSTCGGLLGLTCKVTEYCAFPVATACGSGDQTGTCQAKPMACDLVYGPVCGCDGKTYGNACEAASAGTSVAKNAVCDPTPGTQCGGLQGAACGQGEFCAFPPGTQCGAADQTGTCTKHPEACDDIYAPVCGCDDKTYGNDCEAASAGVSVARTGTCDTTPGKSCGGLLGLGCDKGSFCNFAPAAQCGAADQTGTCIPQPQICDDIYAPVCGCDSKTYSNDCEAAGAGVSVAKTGTCEASSGKSCGGLKGLGCDKGSFCNFPPSAMCGAADQTGTCTQQPQACTQIYAPVCGCDGKTYSSQCVAAGAGVSVAKTGACEPVPGKTCGGLLGVGCDKGSFCNFPPATQCGSGDQTGSCVIVAGPCLANYDPVCGCDGKTYGNACEAEHALQSIAKLGACP